jgi:hypothetical protein
LSGEGRKCPVKLETEGDGVFHAFLGVGFPALGWLVFKIAEWM